MSKWRRRLRRLLRAAFGAVILLTLTYLVMLSLMWHWVAVPPVLAQTPEITRLKIQVRGDRVYLGRNWLEHREGLPVLHLSGTPFEIGYANAALTGPMIARQEDTILALMNRVAPYRWTQFLLKFVVTYKNRHLQSNIPPAVQMEIFGMTLGCPDPHPDLGPTFHRVLNYHAAQDISYMLMNSPLIRGGCTGFAAWGAQTRDGHLLVGRNFDWEPAPVFDQERIAHRLRAGRGHPVRLAGVGWNGRMRVGHESRRAGDLRQRRPLRTPFGRRRADLHRGARCGSARANHRRGRRNHPPSTMFLSRPCSSWPAAGTGGPS
jgi:hypothetical protein